MFPKEFSFGRAADVYLIKTPCLAKRFQLVLSKAAAFAVLPSRWPTGKHHAEARRPPQLLRRLRISSERANVVRFAPESGQIAHVSICRLCAKRRQMQRRKRHSIRSPHRRGRATWAAPVRPSALAVVRSMTRSNFVEARRMRVCYPSRPSARMVSCTFGLAPIRAMYALMFDHFARSILWILVQLSTVNR